MNSYNNFKLSVFCLVLVFMVLLVLPVDPYLSGTKSILQVGLIVFTGTTILYAIESVVLFLVNLHRKGKNHE